MRVLTFQTEDVIHSVVEEGIYHASAEWCREKRDYKLDIEQLNGHQPIWCFAPVSDKSFGPEDFADGSLFDRYRCEMSLRGYLSQFPMIELEVPDSMIKPGLTHNSYAGAKVFPYITKDMLKAVYHCSFVEHYYYAKVFLIKVYAEDILFPSGLQCSKPIKKKTNLD